MTTVTQTPPPLRLRRALDSKDAPPTYPMFAFEVCEDLYEAEGEPQITATGIRRRCPYQNGNFSLQPAYARSASFFVDVTTGNVWTRSLVPAQEQWSAEILGAKLKAFVFPDEVRWLHCQRVPTEHKNQTKYGTLVLDFVHNELNHVERRIYLEEVMPQLGVRTPLGTGEVYLVPEFPDNVGEDLWAGLHIMNTAWKESNGGNTFYSGLVAKDNRAKYFIQKGDYVIRCPKWMFHKFSDPWAEAPKLTA